MTCNSCGAKETCVANWELQEWGWFVNGDRRVCRICLYSREEEARSPTPEESRNRVLRQDTAARWATCFFRCKNSQQTFRQAEALFVKENGYWPPRDLPYMPKNHHDWSRKVRNVPEHELIPVPVPASVPASKATEQQGVLF